MLHLADLHDAVLDSVAIEVEAATVRFVLMPVQREKAAERVTLIAREWKALLCPRREPWGHTRTWYLNEARASVLESGVHLELEMQSGDVIEIDAASVERVDGARQG